jgi:hypothetical protein
MLKQDPDEDETSPKIDRFDPLLASHDQPNPQTLLDGARTRAAVSGIIAQAQ